MARSSAWKGYLRVSLVSVPVRAYTAAATAGGRIGFNQLHAECHSRIRYTKTCPEHGEVSGDEIVLGYEFSKGKYVVVDPEEIEQVRPSGEDRSIAVDAFAPSGSVDPLYLSGKAYYLAPDGPVGQRPYQLIRDAMAEDGLEAVAKVVLSNREQLVLVRPLGRLLVMSVLEYASQLKTPESFEDEVVEAKADKKEVTLARRLIEGMTGDGIDLSEYKDLYTERMTELIEAKVEGKEVVAPPAEDEPAVINLMDALKKSVAQIKRPARSTKAKAAAEPAAKPAAKKNPGPKLAASKTKRKGGRKRAS